MTDDMKQKELRERYMGAVDSFIDKIKDDPSIIAVIISGSLAYDLIWEKSDIDMTVIVRDQVLKNDSYCIIEDDITINVHLMTRSEFKREMERNLGGSWGQSYFAKGKIVYSIDDTLYDYFEDIKKIGCDDIALSVFHFANHLLYVYEKSTKWLKVRKDPLYAQYFLLMAADAISRFELCLNGEPSGRELIQKALKINPEVIHPFYTNLMNHQLSEAELLETIEKIDDYLMKHLDMISKPVIDFLPNQEIKTVTLFAKHFKLDGHFIINMLDYLTDKGVIEKVSQTIRITPKGKLSVEEIGYLYIPH